MHCAPVVEEAVELIAVVAIVIGALLALMVIAMGALVGDNGLLQRTVERCQGSVQPHSQGLKEYAVAGRTITSEWA